MLTLALLSNLARLSETVVPLTEIAIGVDIAEQAYPPTAQNRIYNPWELVTTSYKIRIHPDFNRTATNCSISIIDRNTGNLLVNKSARGGWHVYLATNTKFAIGPLFPRHGASYVSNPSTTAVDVGVYYLPNLTVSYQAPYWVPYYVDFDKDDIYGIRWGEGWKNHAGQAVSLGYPFTVGYVRNGNTYYFWEVGSMMSDALLSSTSTYLDVFVGMGLGTIVHKVGTGQYRLLLGGVLAGISETRLAFRIYTASTYNREGSAAIYYNYDNVVYVDLDAIDALF